MKDYKDFDCYSSKVSRIYIPVPGFKFIHRPCKEDDVASSYIRRDKIEERLANWLRDNNGNKTGAYLITGFRGMGKTSFVGKVINELIKEQNSQIRVFKMYSIILFLYFIGQTILIGYPLTNKYSYIFVLTMITVLFFLDILCLYKVLHHYIISLWTILPIVFAVLYVYADIKNAFLAILIHIVISFFLFCYRSHIITKIGKSLQKVKCCRIAKLGLNITKAENEKHILTIKMNIGNEIINTKDLLSVLAYSIKSQISLYTKKNLHFLHKNVLLRSIQWSVTAIVGIIVYNYIFDILDPIATKFYSYSHDNIIIHFIKAINDTMYDKLRTGNYSLVGSLIGFFLSMLIGFIVSKMVRKAADVVAEYFGKEISKPSRIVNKLTDLCEHINFAINEEKGTHVDGRNFSFINVYMKKRRMKYQQPASVREIEQELVGIIKEINDSDCLQCRLIIVFDELDKLHKSEELGEKDTDLFPEFTFNENGISKDTSLNEKKYRILSLLGQLKYFITSAEAKFIFIAGHELYDAYLADVSDREYSINSIFNGVINVDSFFSCDNGIKYITKLTEVYLCKLLMDKKDINKSENSKNSDFNYDIETFNMEEYSKQIDYHHNNKQKDREVESIIAFLRQFVTYLTFVSNGAPQKLISNFEKYIISKEMYERQIKRNEYSEEHITIKLKNETECSYDYYLAFGYYDQQKIGFIHYIACPIFENIISPASESGDKLLIASSFLVAHILKYHNNGFSWRNMEFMPELLNSSNRIPELREFINSVISYLGQIYFTQISSGIYSYKFPLRIADEITFFSKKSEELSAIFNFSLDYSHAVKNYYYRLFEFYRKKHDVSDAIIGLLHNYLGDIHIANDEYNEAIAQYLLTVQAINAWLDKIKNNDNIKNDELSNNVSAQIIRYTRVMLKLGLAYEKRNTFDSAFMIYSTLTSRLISYREFDEKELGLEYCVVKKNDLKHVVYYPNSKHIFITKERNLPAANDFEKIFYPFTFSDSEISGKIRYWIYGDELTDNLCDMLTPKKYALISKLSVFEDLRLTYLSILAKLFAMEKQGICGITMDNVKIAESEYKYLFMLTNSKEKYLLSVDFFRKLGDILYYKNSSLFNQKQDSIITLVSFGGYDLKNAIFDYCYSNRMVKKDTEHILELFSKNYNYNNVKDKLTLIDIIIKNQELSDDDRRHIKNIIDEIPQRIIDRMITIIECGRLRNNNKMRPCLACHYYSKSLYLMLENLISDNEFKKQQLTKSWSFLSALKCGKLYSYRYHELTQTALTLISMGNALLSCSDNNDKIRGEFIENLFNSDSKWDEFKSFISEIKHISHKEKAILYYWTAMKFHEKANNFKDSAQCLVWIFNMLSYYLTCDKEFNIYNDYFYETFKHSVISAIINIHRTREYKNISEVRILRDIINNGENSKQKYINLGLTSIMPDIEELLLDYYDVLLELSFRRHNNEYWEIINILYNSPSLTCLRNESLSYNRVISLLFKVKLNKRLLNYIFNVDSDDEILKINEKINNYNSNFEMKRDKLKNIFDLSESELNAENLLFFLISDSIFCLLITTDFLHTTMRTTLFTNSFCSNIYKQLFIMVDLKDKFFSTISDDKKNTFNKKFEALVEKHNMKFLRVTYLREMSNMYFKMAESMQTEGLEYKEFIKTMYILDDDLQNNTCQFYFALERCRINYKNMMEISSADNEYFSPEAYFNWKDIKK